MTKMFAVMAELSDNCNFVTRMCFHDILYTAFTFKVVSQILLIVHCAVCHMSLINK